MEKLNAAIVAGLALLPLTLASQEPPGGPTVKHIVGVSYPRLAQFAAAQGSVVLTAVISTEGTVQQVMVTEGNKLLGEPVKATLSRWLFSGCQSKNCEVKIVFNFALLDGTCDSANCPSEFQFDFPNIVTVSSKHFAGPVE